MRITKDQIFTSTDYHDNVMLTEVWQSPCIFSNPISGNQSSTKSSFQPWGGLSVKSRPLDFKDASYNTFAVTVSRRQ
jgi:hypothetical protein